MKTRQQTRAASSSTAPASRAQIKASDSEARARSPADDPDETLDDQTNASSSEDEADSEAPLPKRRKAVLSRTKKTTNTSRRKKGKLSTALEKLPNETMAHICSYLQPSDLLSLVQSSKIFALFLLNKPASTIWKSARLLLQGLPECPSNITEQQFAVLVFGTVCQECGKANIRSSAKGGNSLWIFRRRLCSTCRIRVINGRSDIYKRFDGSNILEFLPLIIPIQDIYPGTLTQTAGQKSWVYNRTEYENVVDYLNQLVEGDRETLREYIGRKMTHNSCMLDFQNEMTKWLQERESARAEELRATRSLRRKDMEERLIEDGYDKNVLDALWDIDWNTLPTINVSKRLTQRAYWKLKPKLKVGLENALRGVKWRSSDEASNSFRAEYGELIRSEGDRHKFQPLFDSVMGLLEVKEPFDKWVEENYLSLSKDLFQGDSVSFPTDLLNLLPTAISKLQTYVEEEFLKLLPAQAGTSSDPHRLQLATTVFRCSDHDKEDHNCLYSYEQALYFMPRVLWGHWGEEWAQHPWPLKENFSFDAGASSTLAMVVEACGFDVESCTFLEMQKSDAYVVCMTCRRFFEEDPRSVMRWEDAPDHWERLHASRLHDDEPGWRIASEGERQFALAIDTNPNNAYHHCLLCPRNLDRGARFAQAQRHHLQTEHEITDGHVLDHPIRFPEGLPYPSFINW